MVLLVFFFFFLVVFWCVCVGGGGWGVGRGVVTCSFNLYIGPKLITSE